jgi:hypothetical protein
MRIAFEAVPQGSPYNGAQLYAKLGVAIRGSPSDHPAFETSVVRHPMLDMIVRSARTGQKQLSR